MGVAVRGDAFHDGRLRHGIGKGLAAAAILGCLNIRKIVLIIADLAEGEGGAILTGGQRNSYRCRIGQLAAIAAGNADRQAVTFLEGTALQLFFAFQRHFGFRRVRVRDSLICWIVGYCR